MSEPQSPPYPDGQPLWREYLELTKPKVVLLLVFTAFVGMLLATPGWVPWQIVVFGNLGIGLAAASAAAINHVVDQRIDSVMRRTDHRPLPKGRISPRDALGFAIVLCVLAMVILVVFTNVLTAVLTFASLVGYAVIYTMYLKRATPQNIVIGGAAGAAPPVLGWVAVTGQVEIYALLLFLIIFVWTPPHFWALAIYRRDDYARADIPMLPVTHGVPLTQVHINLYTVLLLVVSVMPFILGMSSGFYLGGALVLGAGFLYYVLAMTRSDNERIAMQTFGYSILYLTALFAFLLVDHYLPHFV